MGAQLKLKREEWFKLCSSSEGCTNHAKVGGVHRKRTGAKVQCRKICSADGCTKQAQNGGKCIKHGAKMKHETVQLRRMHNICY